MRAAGGVVTRAADAASACRYITDLRRRAGRAWWPSRSRWPPRRSSSTRRSRRPACRWSRPTSASGSCSSPGQHPSHIVAPAVHLNKSQVRDLFMAESGDDLPTDREALVAHARRRLREVFASADIGISGVNLGGGRDRHHLHRRERGQRAPGDGAAAHPRGGDGHGAGGGRLGARPRHILQMLPMAAIGDDARHATST